jgi:hypothetical protein
MPMSDGVSDTDRGWQNVARTIIGFISTFRVLPGEVLTERELAEKEAWAVAHQAVVDVIAQRNETDDGARPGAD